MARLCVCGQRPRDILQIEGVKTFSGRGGGGAKHAKNQEQGNFFMTISSF